MNQYLRVKPLKDNWPPSTNDYRAISIAKASYVAEFNLTVSVVIPFYQNARILARTLASLVNQDYPSRLIEVVVSGDGNEEPLEDIIYEFRSTLNVSYVRQERLGHRVATARNRGIHYSNGEVIVSLDFDMICPPNFLTSHLAWFHVSNDIATIGLRKFINADNVTVSDILFSFDNVACLPKVKSVSNNLQDTDEREKVFLDFFNQKFPGNFFYTCNVAYRKQQALEIGGFDEIYNYNSNYEDIDFGHRLWKSGVFIAAEQGATAYHQENAVVTYQQRIEGKNINRMKLYHKFPELMSYRRSIGKM